MFNGNIEPGTIETWFPKSIYYKDGICIDKLDQWKEDVLNFFKGKTLKLDSDKKVFSSYGQVKFITRNIQGMDVLEDMVLNHAHVFLKELGYSFKLELGTCWVNLCQKGDYFFPHVHTDSILSGVFYVCASETDYLTFYSDEDYFSPADQVSLLSLRQTSYHCTPSRLLLFKSDIKHGFVGRESDAPKISIAFNLKRKVTI